MLSQKTRYSIRALQHLADNWGRGPVRLDAIAEALLERETLDHDEIQSIMNGETLPPRTRVVIPTYAEKQAAAKDKRKGAIFTPRPREVPSGG